MIEHKNRHKIVKNKKVKKDRPTYNKIENKKASK